MFLKWTCRLYWLLVYAAQVNLWQAPSELKKYRISGACIFKIQDLRFLFTEFKVNSHMNCDITIKNVSLEWLPMPSSLDIFQKEDKMSIRKALERMGTSDFTNRGGLALNNSQLAILFLSNIQYTKQYLYLKKCSNFPLLQPLYKYIYITVPNEKLHLTPQKWQ